MKNKEEQISRLKDKEHSLLKDITNLENKYNKIQTTLHLYPGERTKKSSQLVSEWKDIKNQIAEKKEKLESIRRRIKQLESSIN